MPEIKWFGHACFGVRGRDVSLLFDPVPEASGYTVGLTDPDIVLITHDHYGHNARDLVTSDSHIVSGPGEYEIREVLISGVQTYHDQEKGAALGRNTIYLIEIDEIQICHLGDLGHALTDPQIEALSSVDVLMVPVGGDPTLSTAEAVEIIGQLEPRIVLPMQFRTEFGDHSRESVDRFLREVGVEEYEAVDSLTLRPGDLNDSMKVIVLNPARD